MVLLKLDPGLKLNKIEIIKLLSNDKKRSRVFPKRMEKKLDVLIEESKKYIVPKAVYDIYEVNELPPKAFFKEAEKVAMAICTIGDSLPNQVTKLTKQDNLTDGVILDAIGSISVESVADKVNELINQTASEMSLNTTSRYSPGYCSSPVTDQKIIFDNLPAQGIGVTLSETSMMYPLKSISFFVNFANDAMNTRWENRCVNCKKIDCQYRFKPYRGKEYDI